MNFILITMLCLAAFSAVPFAYKKTGRPRGRPRKNPAPESAPVETAEIAETAESTKTTETAVATDPGKQIEETFPGDPKTVDTETELPRFGPDEPDETEASEEEAGDAAEGDEGDTTVDLAEGDAEPAAEPAAPPVVADEFDAEILGLAGQMGVSIQDARSFGSVGKLEDYLAKISGAGPAGEFNIELNDEEVSPEIGAAFKKMNAHYTGRMAQMEASMSRMEQATVAERRRADAMWFDQAIEGLPDEYGDLFGKGGMATLGLKSQELANRHLLATEIDAMHNGHGGRAPGRTVLMERALRSVFGDRVNGAARKQVEQQVKKRSKQTMSRPTHRTAVPADGTEAAVAKAERFYKEHDLE